MPRILSFIISSLFVCCLFVPPILWMATGDKKLSKIEKRRLASRPVLELSRESLREFPGKFEKYFGDHFGGREQLIALYGAINFTLFGKSPVVNVALGKDLWLFLRGEGVLYDYMGMDKASPERLEEFKRVLVDRRNWLAERGIQYLFVPVPNKMMVYDEFLPERMRKEAGRTLYDQLLDYLAEHSDFQDYLDVKEILLQAKKEQLVFLKTDTHWNSDGSFIVYQHIMETLREQYPQLKVLQRSDLERTEVRHAGDLARMMHMKKLLVEKAPSNKLKERCAKEKTWKMRSFVHREKKLAHNYFFLPEMNSCPQEKYTALVIHDSFGYFLRPWLSESFSRIIYMHYSDFNGLKHLIEKKRPDIVIDQRVARHLSSAMHRDQELENYFTQKHFLEQDQVLLHLDGMKSGLENLDSHDLVLSKGQGGLELDVTGDDPYLGLTFTADRDNEPILVKIVLTSPHDTELQFQYTTKSFPRFNPPQVVHKEIHTGLNELIFRLPAPDVSSQIRVVPGAKQGKYVLKSLILKREMTRLTKK